MAQTSRRNFLKASALATAAGSLSQFNVHAAGNDTLKIGLVGCGGRGTGAAAQALRADPNLKLWAVADAFRDRLDGCLNTLRNDRGVADKLDVPAERCFTGFDAYKDVIASGVDVVLLCSPPGFRPIHLKAAVDAGKHVFAEKPIAVDAPGVRAVMAACVEARRKNLAVVSGLCWRYHNGMRETFKRVHDGSIGDIVAMQATYNTGLIWTRPRLQNMTDMEWQMRNWYYFTWLSGDYNVEQHVHSLDKMAWAMKNEYPVKCVGLGGRQVRIGDEHGHIFDHMAVVYEYASGTRCYSFSRQHAGCANEVKDYLMGTQGKVDVMAHNITGTNPWRYPAVRPGQPRRPGDDMYQQEHVDMYASIRAGQPINDGDWMSKSTLMGIMGRMACYTGKSITWAQAMDSTENLSPPSYRWEQPMSIPEVARPGVTQFS